jgi:hypothetical protein
MAINRHIVAGLDGSNFNWTDRVILGTLQVTTAAGGGAGASVTTPVTFAEELPSTYEVFLQPGQDAVAYVSGKTNAGFNIVQNPRLAANTLAAGTVDVLLVA